MELQERLLPGSREDRAAWTRGLPEDVFNRHRIDRSRPDSEHSQEAFVKGLRELIGITHDCLRDSMQFARLILTSEAGFHRFCLWAIGLWLLTLQNIRRRPFYRAGTQVKVSRTVFKVTIVISALSARYNEASSTLFQVLSVGLRANGQIQIHRAQGGIPQ